MNTESQVLQIPETSHPCPACVAVGHPPEKCEPASWLVDGREMCGDCYESAREFFLEGTEEVTA